MKRLNLALITLILVLFFAGFAIAEPPWIRTRHIVNGEVSHVDMNTDAIDSTNVIDGGISSASDIAWGTVDFTSSQFTYAESVAGNTTNATLTSDDSGQVQHFISMSEKKDVTLPSAAAGILIKIAVDDADSLRIAAASGDSIFVIDSAAWTHVGSYATSVAGYIELLAVNATRWYVKLTSGTWTCY